MAGPATLMCTSSRSARYRTIWANIRGTGPNLPGQEFSLWGQLSQVPRWGSHSAGIRYPSLAGVGFSSVVEVAFSEVAVSVDAAIAQEGPVSAARVHFG